MHNLNPIMIIKKYFSWQQRFILRERNIGFIYGNTPKQLVDILRKKIISNKGKNYFKRLFSIEIIEENDNKSIIIKKKSNILWSTVYIFRGNIFGKEGKSYIFGKYGMDIFYKIFILLWLNSSILFAVILLLLTTKDILNYAFFNQNYFSLSRNSTGILLSLLIIISGYIFVYIIRYIDNPKYINDFFDSINTRKIDSDTIEKLKAQL